MEFGRWLTEQREGLGLKRREAAKRSKLSDAVWKDLEAGRKEPIGGIRLLPNPSAAVLETVAATLEIPLDELMKRVGRSPRALPPRGAAPDDDRPVLVHKISRLAPRDRQLVELLVDAMLDSRDT